MTARHIVPPGAKSDEEQLLKIVANQLAIAVENARLYAETQERLRQTETLLSVSQAVGSTLNIAEAARRTTAALVRSLGADLGGAWQLTPDRDRLIPLAGYHVPKDLFAQGRRARCRPPAAACSTRCGSWAGPALRERQQPPIPDSTTRCSGCCPHKSVLVVPMRFKDEVVGGFAVAWLREHHEFTARGAAAGGGHRAAGRGGHRQRPLAGGRARRRAIAWPRRRRATGSCSRTSPTSSTCTISRAACWRSTRPASAPAAIRVTSC